MRIASLSMVHRSRFSVFQLANFIIILPKKFNPGKDESQP